MSNIQFSKSISFAILTIIVFLVGVTAIITFVFHDSAYNNSFAAFALNNHLAIMVVAIIISIGYGFFWSKYLLGEIKKEETNTQSLFDIILGFLGVDEKEVLKHLVEENGKSTQAKIAHIKNMGAVKALRTVQKMKEKNLVDVEARGKVRIIILKEKIYDLLTSKEEKS